MTVRAFLRVSEGGDALGFLAMEGQTEGRRGGGGGGGVGAMVVGERESKRKSRTGKGGQKSVCQVGGKYLVVLDLEDNRCETFGRVQQHRLPLRKVECFSGDGQR